MTDDYNITKLEDREDLVYLISVGEKRTSRMLETIGERFDSLFEHATYIVFGVEDIGGHGLDVYEVSSESVKDAMQDFEDASDEGEQVVALKQMVDTATEADDA